MKPIIAVVLVVVLLSLFAVACGQPEEEQDDPVVPGVVSPLPESITSPQASPGTSPDTGY